jgi:hypothetical protein
MSERFPIQKEFGEVKSSEGEILITKFGSKGEVVGRAKYFERAEPSPHLVLSSLNVASGEKGKGFATQLMAEAERISQESGKPMLLYDAILVYGNANPDATGMYGRRPGWTRLREANGKATHYYVYGSRDPEFFSQILKKAAGARKKI